MEQIDKLANFIMSEIPGEPSLDEGAGDCAIRIIKDHRDALEKLACLGNGNFGGNSEGNVIAQRALGLDPTKTHGIHKNNWNSVPSNTGTEFGGAGIAMGQAATEHKGLTAEVCHAK